MNIHTGPPPYQCVAHVRCLVETKNQRHVVQIRRQRSNDMFTFSESYYVLFLGSLTTLHASVCSAECCPVPTITWSDKYGDSVTVLPGL